MAKISANGAHKACEAYFDQPTDNLSAPTLGPVARTHYVLRSDHVVLVCHSWPQATHPYDRRRTGYKVLGKVKVDADTPFPSLGEAIRYFIKYTERQATRRNSVLVCR